MEMAGSMPVICGNPAICSKGCCNKISEPKSGLLHIEPQFVLPCTVYNLAELAHPWSDYVCTI